QDTMTLYYFDDYSLGEIAEQFGVSRQAIYDTLKRTESMLEEFEEKLALLSKFQKRTTLLDDLKQLAASDEKVLAIVDSLEKLD
ncbi:MAG TPA: sigma factor-like helix-turn-helix DNA-binding protein, partial [Bacillales bacterium]|nr:sigma factor-like helix-turn-helix DNA-binding protein [Bacillales bacterium]